MEELIDKKENIRQRKNFYVITGGPGVGKTRVIEELRKRGYRVIDEIAREIVKNDLEKGIKDPQRQYESFQNRVAKRQLKTELNTEGEDIFLDRGLVDGYAYSKFSNTKPSKLIRKFGKKRYKKVFLLEPLPQYNTDDERIEKQEEQIEIHNQIRKAYKKFGYKIIDVPFLPPEKRADFIEKYVNPKGLFAKMRYFLNQYERPISAIALLSGFVFDSLTLTQIDRLYDNAVIITYLMLSALGILLVNLYESGRVKNKIFRFFHSIFPIVIQFAFGGLFSAFTIFYSRSTTLAGSWPFLLILIGLLFGNEMLRRHYRRFSLQFSLLYFAIFSYLIFAVPIVLQKINSIIFLVSGFTGLIIIYFYSRVFKKLIPELYKKTKIITTISVTSIFVVINFLYFLNYIPPIPLSISHIDVYHSVDRNTNGNYVVVTENRSWIKELIFDDVIHITEGEDIFVFSSVYAPLDLETNIVHRWMYYNKNVDEWQTVSKISFAVLGGRKEGYRGYTLKNNPDFGNWRVNVETERGQVIGSIKFKVEEFNQKVELTKEEI